MAIFPGSAIPSAVSDYEIDNSLRFNDGDSPYLARTMTSAGDKKKWTASFWYKRSLDASSDNPLSAIDGTLAFSNIQFSSDMVQMEHYPGTTSAKLRTTRLFRDPSAWYHIVMNSDTTLATADDRMKIYVNGVQETDFAIRTNPAQNMDWYFNDGSSDLEVSRLTTHGQYLDGYLAEFYYIDGTALAPSTFGELDSDTNQWKPLDSDDVKDAVTFGTNGFYQKYNSTELAASFADSASHQPHTVTANGNTHTDTSVKKIGTASAQFDGTGDYLSIPDSSDFDLTATADWTVEFWVYRTQTESASTALINRADDGGHGWNINWDGSDKVRIYNANDGSGGVTASTAITVNTWTQVAFVYTVSGTSLKVYLDGVLDNTNTSSPVSWTNVDTALWIGAQDLGSGATRGFTGYLDEIRLSKGIARYVGAFTPSTTEFTSDQYTKLLLHCDGSDSGTTFTDSADSAPRHTITANGDATNQRPQPHDVTANGDAHLIGPKVGPSVAAFDSSGDYISAASSSDWGWGTGDFTVEGWFNLATVGNYNQLAATGSPSDTWRFSVEDYAKPSWNHSGSGPELVSSKIVLPDTWFHLAVSRSSGTSKMFLDGVEVDSASDTYSYPAGALYIGAYSTGAYGLDGYMEGFRISNSARYTADFTPPTDVFTNDSNTKLLITNGTDGTTTFDDLSSGDHTLTANGDVRWFAPKVGAGAMAFDGTGDYLSVPAPGASFPVGTTWTLEGWFFIRTDPTTSATNLEMGSLDVTGSNDKQTNKFCIQSNGSNYGSIRFISGLDSGYNPNEYFQTTGTTPLSQNTWTHIAVGQNAGTAFIYVGGVSQTVTTVGSPTFRSVTNTSANYQIGAAGGAYALNAYLDGFRISSVARYTGTFTPPTTAFTDDINTNLILNADLNQGTWAEDTSTGLAISTDSRMKFDGTGDYLSVPDSSDWDLTGDFTIEFWFNLLRTTGDPEGFIMSGDDNWKLWYMSVGGNPKLHWEDDEGYINASTTALVAGQWYHTAIVRSGTTVTMYIDGASEGTRTTTGTISGTTLEIGRGIYSGTNYYIKGYMDEIRISDSARYTGTFTPQTRGNPFEADANTKLLIHSDYTGGLGADSSGNYNNFTATNLVATDQMIDTPTNNFCTLNPAVFVPGTGWDGSDGNLSFTRGADDAWGTVASTIAPGSGKWYFEGLLVSTSGTVNTGIGIVGTNANEVWSGSTNGTGDIATVKYDNYGTVSMDGSALSPNPYGATYAAGDIIGVVYDMDASPRTCTFYKNNTIVNAAFDLSSNFTASKGIAPLLHVWGREKWTMNFGQDSSFAGAKTAQGNQDGNGKGDFYYEPPTDYLALCTDNLSTPEIKLPGENFNTVLYTGDGSTQAVSGVGFKPDFVWLKNRNSTGSQMAYDSIRGATYYLHQNETNAQTNGSNLTSNLQSFDSDGFTVIYRASNADNTNKDTYTYASWNWLAGGAPTADNSAGAGATPTAGSVKIDGSNLGSALAGSIPAIRLSANTGSGFSIVQYQGNVTSGATVAHGLSQAPEFTILRNYDADHDWQTYAQPIGNTKYLSINSTSAEATSSTRWNDTTPSSSVITLGNSNPVNASGEDIIIYCFHEVEGYSKVGKFDGNSVNGDGPFLYTGFAPAMVIIKMIEPHNYEWLIFDNKRPSYNVVSKRLIPNANTAEGTGTYLDFVSNGIKLRDNSYNINHSSATYLFYAVAESPFKYSTAR